MRVVTIVGARPQFIKAAAVSRVVRERHEEYLIHTGQHSDYEMSGIFFDGLELSAPDMNLEVGSGAHGWQTGRMLEGIEKVIQAQRPDWLRTVTLSFPSGRTAEEVVVDDAAGLAWIVNLGCIELHPHPVRSGDLDHRLALVQPDDLAAQVARQERGSARRV